MASGYLRQSTANIQSLDFIHSVDINKEFNAIQSTMDNNIGHDHSGSSPGTGNKIDLTTSVTNILQIENSGTGNNLPPSNGGLLTCTNSNTAILAPTSTANQVVLSGSNITPQWSNINTRFTAGPGINITGTTNSTITFNPFSAFSVKTGPSGVSTIWSNSSTPTMGGIGSTLSGGAFVTGNIIVSVTFNMQGSNQGSYYLAWGTGSPPNFHANATGTQFTSKVNMSSGTNDSYGSICGIIKGAPLNQNIWVDFVGTATSTGLTLSNIGIIFVELR